MNPQSPTARYRRHPSVADRQVGEERLLVPVRTDVSAPVQVMALNATASALWDALAAPRTVTELAATIEQGFDIALDQAQADAERFLGELVRLELVEREAP